MQTRNQAQYLVGSSQVIELLPFKYLTLLEPFDLGGKDVA